MLENTEGAIQKDNSEKLGYIRRRKSNQKHNTICVEHHCMKVNKNSVNKTCALLQTTGCKDEPHIVYMRKSTRTQTHIIGQHKKLKRWATQTLP
jgi:hypothetical protein